MSTIAAISSPIGAGGIGIVRVSGDEALRIADAIFNFAHNTRAYACVNNNVADGNNTADSNNVADSDTVRREQAWEPLHMHYGTFVADDFTDKGYAVYFPANRSYTGEDTVEFYLHGGVRIVKGALDTILSRGAVQAGRGEFTKCAFLNGRLSLADAEGVIDMINAESAAGLRAAYRLMDGELAKKINALLERLGGLIATLEATLDYPDEMEDEVLPSLPKETAYLINEVNAMLSSARNGKIAKYGLNVVLAGKTNAGKSSLMNALLKYDRAIVTPIAGTTRDTVEDSFECDGVKINLIDTAGIRQSDDVVEAQGIARARRAYEGADVILHVIDKSARGSNRLFDGMEDIDLNGKMIFTVYNKCDEYGFAIPRMANTFGVSAKTGEGVDMLAKSIAALYRSNSVEGGELITNERHISALYQAKTALENAFASLNDTIDCTLIDLRRAYDALGEITGKTAKEDVVDSIFDKFCVGK